MTRFIIRDEVFGSILYDKKHLIYKFLSHRETDEFTSQFEQKGMEVEHWQTNITGMRADVICSPIRIYYEVTLKCNIQCKLCFNDSGKPRAKELSTREILSSLDKLRRANVIDLRFTGGEITQHPDWFEILEYAKWKGFVVSCNTNGVYSDLTVIEKLLSLSLDQITISLDGIGAAHEKNRGKNTYAKTLASLKHLSCGGAHIRINTLISRWSLDQVDEIIELASLYAEEINFFPFRFIGRGLKQVDNSISMNEYYQMAHRAFSLREKYPQLRILHFAQSFHSRSVDQDGLMGLQMGGPDGFTCFNITSDGKFWAGGYAPYIDPNCYMGHILEDDLLNVWQKSEKLDENRRKSYQLKSICQNCSIYMRECPGSMYEIEHLRLLNPELKNPFCIHGSGPSLLSDQLTIVNCL